MKAGIRHFSPHLANLKNCEKFSPSALATVLYVIITIATSREVFNFSEPDTPSEVISLMEHWYISAMNQSLIF